VSDSSGPAARFGLAVVLVVGIGVALRSLPLFASPLPFNPDGVLAAGWARSTIDTGSLPLASIAVDDLSFTAFLAILSEVTGVRPLFISQPAIAVVGTLPGLLAVAVGRRLGLARGFDRGTARRAGLFGGLLLAVEGLYLHRSMPVEDQTLGLFVVPLGLLAVYRGYRRRSGAWYVAGGLLLASVPPLHNLDTAIAALGLVLLVVVAGATSSRRATPLAVGAVGFAVIAVGYNLAAAALTPAEITQSARLLDFPGLFVAWIVLMGLVLAWIVRGGSRRQRVLVLGVLGSWFLLLLANAVRSVFPGTPSTPPLLTSGLLPLLLPVTLAAWVAPDWREPEADGPVLWALFGGVVALVGFSLTAALTPEFVTTVYRTQTFLHFPIMASAGVGAVFLVRKLTRGRLLEGPASVGSESRSPTRSNAAGRDPSGTGRAGTTARRLVTVAVLVLIVASVVASIPIALGGLEVLPYKGVTTPAELSAAGFAATHADGSWAGDDHVVRIAPYHGSHHEVTAGSRGPVYRWLHDGGEPPRCLTMSQRSWTTTGAQFYPAPPAKLDRTRYARTLTRRHVVYATTSADPVVATLPREGSPSSCNA
jgi:hypothetical protein